MDGHAISREALGGGLSDAEPPMFPPAAKRRRTGMDGGSVAHLRVVWQVGPDRAGRQHDDLMTS